MDVDLRLSLTLNDDWPTRVTVYALEAGKDPVCHYSGEAWEGFQEASTKLHDLWVWYIAALRNEAQRSLDELAREQDAAT